VYEEALCCELDARHIPFTRQHPVSVVCKGKSVGESRIDLLVHGELIVELKAVETLAPIHTAQVISYLKATRLVLGLLINFNISILKEGIKRVVLSQHSAG
jgi:GxxExxY protein